MVLNINMRVGGSKVSASNRTPVLRLLAAFIRPYKVSVLKLGLKMSQVVQLKFRFNDATDATTSQPCSGCSCACRRQRNIQQVRVLGRTFTCEAEA